MSERMNKERAIEILEKIKSKSEEYIKSPQSQTRINTTELTPLKNAFVRKQEYAKEKVQALDIAIESLEREDKLIELAEQNKWHTEQPQEDRQYLVTYYQECDLLIMCKWKNKQWYDSKGFALDNDRVVAWKKVEPYLFKHNDGQRDIIF